MCGLHSPGENRCPNARQKQGDGEKGGLEKVVGPRVLRPMGDAVDTLKVSRLLGGTAGVREVLGEKERGMVELVAMGEVALVVSSGGI